MFRLRRALTCGWLVLQLAGFAAAPIAMCVDDGGSPVTRHGKACCPGIAPGRICPMHHTREDGGTCTMSGACHAGDVALLSLIASAGVPALRARAVSLSATGDRLQPFVAAPIVRAELPESPPPRT